MEFLIRRTDGEWFDLHSNRFEEVLRPNSFSSRKVQGNAGYCIEVDNCIIEMNYEMPGLQIIFNGDISHDSARKIVEEICQNITSAIGQSGEILDFTGELKGKVIRLG